MEAGLGVEERAENGRDIKRAARRVSEFLRYLAARIRALCALLAFAVAAVAQTPAPQKRAAVTGVISRRFGSFLVGTGGPSL